MQGKNVQSISTNEFPNEDGQIFMQKWKSISYPLPTEASRSLDFGTVWENFTPSCFRQVFF